MTAPAPSFADALRHRYTLERELGRGGMATVYLARDLRHDRSVALKVLSPELAASLGPERFLREIQLTARLQHPHILPVHDSGEAAGRLWYTMPFVEGESLRDRLAREKLLPLEDALQITRNVLAALAYAHGHGVIHRDIKPENILLEAGEAVVADFGIAHALDAAGGERLTETGLALGTPVYMSPEQGAGDRGVGVPSDIYSVGTVLYEMLAGEPPFTGPNAQAVIARRLAEAPRGIRVVRDTVPESVERAVYRALARIPADRFATAADFAAALVPQTVSAAAVAPRPRRRLRLIGVAIAGLGILGALAATLFFRPVPAPVLDADLIAVAPFDVLAPGLALWREGLVDLLARNLDGAGPLRTVPPSVVVRHWAGRADPPSATALARKTGAKLAVFGQLLATRADSVRLTATLFDVAAGRPLGVVEFRELGTSMDRLADSLTVALLRELGRARPIAAVRQSSFASVELPVLRAFLRGEQFFRRTAWDSAMTYYEQAVTLDSGFAVAWRRMNGVRGCGRKGFRGDPLAHEYGLRAGALNRGLAPRDSLLIAADSLSEALFEEVRDSAWREHHGRLFSTLNAAVQRYPTDPEVWYELGEALYHWPNSGRTTPGQVLEAFDRAIALDSAFGPAYIHPIEVEFQLGHGDVAKRYLDSYLALNQTDPNSEGMELVEQVLAERARSPATAHQLEAASSYVLFSALWVLRHIPDSAETSVRVARALSRSRPTGEPVFDDSLVRKWALGRALVDRGHLEKAYALVADRFPEDFVNLALLGAVPADRAGATFRGWMRSGDSTEPSFEAMGARLGALSWWSSAGDTAALRESAGRWESLKQRAVGLPELALWADYGLASSRAHLALARGDTADAVRRFAALPDSVCTCVPDRIATARLLRSGGRTDQAREILARTWPRGWDPASPRLLLERARVADRLGERERALELYRYVADLWRNADPGLQSYVNEARDRLRHFVADPT